MAPEHPPDDDVNERPPAPAVFRVFNELGIIQQLARTRMERDMPFGLRMSQFTVLNHFVRLGGESTPARLARAFQVTKGAMTNTLQRLQAHGFIAVEPDPDDGRGKRVRITGAGRDAHTACIDAIAPALRGVQANFGAQAFADALPFLEQLRRYLDEHRGQ